MKKNTKSMGAARFFRFSHGYSFRRFEQKQESIWISPPHEYVIHEKRIGSLWRESAAGSS